MRKVFFVTLATLMISFLVGINPVASISTQYQIYQQDGKDINGWHPQQGNTITINVWLDGLNNNQKGLTKAAFKEWGEFETADGNLGNSNYDGSNPVRENHDIMNGQTLQDGTSGRNMTKTDIDGMKALYDGKTFNFNYVDNKDDATIKVELSNQEGSTGGCNWNANGDITSGYIKLPTNNGNVGGDPPISREWYYVTDTDKDGIIENSDKDAAGKLISEYTTIQGDFEYFNQIDFYSQVRHEIGHALGFDHSTVPEPSSLLLFVMGLTFFIRFGWYSKKMRSQ